MEIVNVDLIVISIIVIYLLFLLMINAILPTYRINYLNKTVFSIDKNYELYIELINKYLKKEENKAWRNIYLVMKINGFRKTENWGELKSTIEIIDINRLPYVWKKNYCFSVLNLFMIGRIEEGNIMSIKLNNLSKINLYRVSSSKVVFAVYDYYNKPLQNNYDIFKDLLKIKQKSNYITAVIYLYLGLIEQQNNNIKESKMHYEKAKSFGVSTVVYTKSEELLKRLDE